MRNSKPVPISVYEIDTHTHWGIQLVFQSVFFGIFVGIRYPRLSLHRIKCRVRRLIKPAQTLKLNEKMTKEPEYLWSQKFKGKL